MKNKIDIEYRKIPVATLKVHPKVQRPLNREHAEKIAKNWHPIAVNAITVIKMTSGDRGYYIIDGQHTYTAARMVGVLMLDCKIIRANTHAEMNEIFQVINDGVRRVSPLDSFVMNANNDSRTNDAKMNQILETCSLKVGYGKNTHTINCAAALRDEFTSLGVEKFAIAAAFFEVLADSGNRIDVATVRAISDAVRKYSDFPQDVEDLTDLLENEWGSIKATANSKCRGTTLHSSHGILSREIYNRMSGGGESRAA